MKINSKMLAFALENIFFAFWLTDSTDTGSLKKKKKKRLILCIDQNGKNQTNKKENNNA